MVTGYRFGKHHRYNNTWQYRFLNTVGANIFADLRVMQVEELEK